MAHRPQFATLLLVLRLSLTTQNSFTGGKATWRVLTRWQDHRSPTECWVLCFSAARMLSFISYNNPVREELGSSLLYRCSNWSPGSPWSELGFSRSVLTTVSDCLLWWTQCHGNHKWWLMFFKNTDFFFFFNIYTKKKSGFQKKTLGAMRPEEQMWAYLAVGRLAPSPPRLKWFFWTCYPVLPPKSLEECRSHFTLSSLPPLSPH